ncbi:MAG: hypothetical protein WAN23_01660, partial [Candidatus Acidiferrales bacterium]
GLGLRPRKGRMRNPPSNGQQEKREQPIEREVAREIENEALDVVTTIPRYARGERTREQEGVNQGRLSACCCERGDEDNKGGTHPQSEQRVL